MSGFDLRQAQVRSEDVRQVRHFKALRKRCGKKGPLKRNGYFDLRPHLNPVLIQPKCLFKRDRLPRAPQSQVSLWASAILHAAY
jgi:hypothetical protein